MGPFSEIQSLAESTRSSSCCLGWRATRSIAGYSAELRFASGSRRGALQVRRQLSAFPRRREISCGLRVLRDPRSLSIAEGPTPWAPSRNRAGTARTWNPCTPCCAAGPWQRAPQQWKGPGGSKTAQGCIFTATAIAICVSHI